MREYTIVGDTERGECLIVVTSKECAEQSLARVKADPEKYQAANHKNIRIKVEEIKNAWWRDPFLVN